MRLCSKGHHENDAVVRAFEILTGTKVHRSNIPEIMGAYGCALYAKTKGHGQATVDDMIHVASFKDAQLTCHGCETTASSRSINSIMDPSIIRATNAKNTLPIMAMM